MLKIRLARIGKRKQPTYRFVVSDSLRDTYGRALEIVGHYNPRTKVCEVQKDRILYWVSKGAQLSPTVNNLFIDQNIVTGQKVKASKAGKKKTAEEAAKAAGEAKPTAKVEAKPAEKPAEAPPATEAKPEEKKDEPKVEEKKEEKPTEPEKKTETKPEEKPAA